MVVGLAVFLATDGMKVEACQRGLYNTNPGSGTVGAHLDLRGPAWSGGRGE